MGSMSFLDEPKNYGLVALLLGILMLVISAWNAIDGDGGMSFVAVLAGVFVLIFGFLLYSGRVTDNFEIVKLFMIFIGIAMALAGGFEGYAMWVGIIFAVIGVLLYFGIKSDILWWVAILVGLIYVIINIVDIIQGGFNIGMVTGILLWVLVVYFVYNLFTSGVRSKF